MSTENRQYCDDCGRETNKLISTECCHDYNCCEKNICADNCLFTCRLCDKNFSNSKEGKRTYDNEVHCNECAKEQPKEIYTKHSKCIGAIYWIPKDNDCNLLIARDLHDFCH